MMHIFRTNISTLRQLKAAELLLSRQKKIIRWNVDIDDCDKVLRVESPGLKQEQIINMLEKKAIYCEELE